MIPRDLKIKIAEQLLIIEWPDSVRSEFPMALLRRECPCATCRTERDEKDRNPLTILKSDPADLKVVNAEMVGNYAIRLFWSDSHDSGIFDFRFLRSLHERSSGGDEVRE